MPSRDLCRDDWIPVKDATDRVGIHQSIRLGPSDSASLVTWRLGGRFADVLKVELVGVPSPEAATTGLKIGVKLEHGQPGEPPNMHSISDTSTLYDLSGMGGQLAVVADITGLFIATGPGDVCAIEVNHAELPGPIDYLGMRFSHAWF